MANYALSPAAQADLDSIWGYTATHWGEAQAENYLRRIEAACEALADGALVSQSADNIRAGYRRASVGSHVLFFRFQAGVVEIIRILHQSMDVERHL